MEGASEHDPCWHSVLEDLPELALLLLDADGNVAKWNAGAERVFGYSDEEVVGRPGTMLFTEQDIRLGIPENQLARARQNGRTEDERWHRRKTGELFWASNITAVLRDGAGQITGYVKIARDLTERKLADERREKLLSELGISDRLRDLFLATISHELRTPLAAIVGWISLIRAKRLDSNQTAVGLESIERNAHHQATLIDEMLDASRIATGQLSLNVGPVDLEQILAEALDAVRFMGEAKNLAIRSDVEGQFDVIEGDASRIQQILWNLLNNAIKFTPREGNVSVSLRHNGSMVEIAVRDDGQGMAEEFIPHAFEAFRQEYDTSTRSHGGLGLGLAIVRQLAQLHGGDVSASSPGLGHGSTFLVRLPYRKSRLQPNEQHRSGRPAPDALAGIHVLIVENDPDCRDFLVQAITSYGGVAKAAKTAGEALRMLKKWRVSMLVIDLALPDEDGYALWRKIRDSANQKEAALPAVALTALATEEYRTRAFAEGFSDFITKPATAETIVQTVLQVLQSNESPDEIAS